MSGFAPCIGANKKRGQPLEASAFRKDCPNDRVDYFNRSVLFVSPHRMGQMGQEKKARLLSLPGGANAYGHPAGCFVFDHLALWHFLFSLVGCQ